MRVKGQSLLAVHRVPAHRGVISPGLLAPEPHAENTAALVHPAASEGGPEYPKAPYPPRGPPHRPRAGPQAGSASWPVEPQQCLPHPAGGASSLRRLRSPAPDVTARGRHGDGLTSARVRASSLLATARSPLPLYRHRAARRSGVKATSMGCAGRGGRGGAGPTRGGAGRGVAACGRRRRGADMRRGPGGGSSVGGGGAKGRRRSRASSRAGGVPGRAHGGRRR